MNCNSHHASGFIFFFGLIFCVHNCCLVSPDRSELASTMKLQVAAALCALVLVASEMAVTSEAAGCDIVKLAPCYDASKSEQVAPTAKCCDNISEIMGQDFSGAQCLCTLLSQPLPGPELQGYDQSKVVVQIALGIPKRCRLPVPRGWVCQGISVPGG